MYCIYNFTDIGSKMEYILSIKNSMKQLLERGAAAGMHPSLLAKMFEETASATKFEPMSVKVPPTKLSRGIASKSAKPDLIEAISGNALEKVFLEESRARASDASSIASTESLSEGRAEAASATAPTESLSTASTKTAATIHAGTIKLEALFANVVRRNTGSIAAAAPSNSAAASSNSAAATAPSLTLSMHDDKWADVNDADDVEQYDKILTNAKTAFEPAFMPAKSDTKLLIQAKPVAYLHKTIFGARFASFNTEGLPEFIHKMDTGTFVTFLKDTTRWPRAYNPETDSRDFTIRKLIQLFLPDFFKHHLNDYFGKKAEQFTTLHLGYSTSRAVRIISSNVGADDASSSLNLQFGLSPSEAPSEMILREIALIQVIQQFILQHIFKILIKERFTPTQITSTILQLDFKQEKALKTFSDRLLTPLDKSMV
jgi:hypothetical protein